MKKKRIISSLSKELVNEYLKYCQSYLVHHDTAEVNYVEFYDADSPDLKKIMYSHSPNNSLIIFLQEKIYKQNEIIKSLKSNIKDISRTSNNRYHAILNLQNQIKSLKNKIKIQNEIPESYKNLETKRFEQLCGLFDIDERILNLFAFLNLHLGIYFSSLSSITLIITRDFNKSEELFNKMIKKYKGPRLANPRKNHDESFQMRLNEEKIFIADISYILNNQKDGIRINKIVFYDNQIRIIEGGKK